jgi:hypothetical protein
MSKTYPQQVHQIHVSLNYERCQRFVIAFDSLGDEQVKMVLSVAL